MKFLQALIITIAIFGIGLYVYTGIKDREKTNITYNTAVVVGIGQCNKTDCSFTYKTSSGEVRFGTSSSPVSTGQIVYQQCWTEKARGDRCYTDYSPSKD